MDQKENQRIRLTKTLLRNSLIDIMHEKRVTQITIKELCTNAGINRSTFYLYYSSQSELLEEIEQELVENSTQHLKRIDSNLNSMQYLHAFLSYIRDNADLFQLLLCRSENLSFQTNYVNQTIPFIKANVEIHSSEAKAKYIYRYLVLGSLSMIQQWIESSFDLSTEELANIIYQLADRALVNEL